MQIKHLVINKNHSFIHKQNEKKNSNKMHNLLNKFVAKEKRPISLTFYLFVDALIGSFLADLYSRCDFSSQLNTLNANNHIKSSV